MFRQQADFVLCDTPFVAAIAGRGGGKTEGGAIKLWLFMVKHPGCMGFVTAPDLNMLNTATLVTVRKVFPKGMYDFAEGVEGDLPVHRRAQQFPWPEHGLRMDGRSCHLNHCIQA
jgi:hypothetical protein